MADGRALFDAVIASYRSTKFRLRPIIDIVENVQFEKAILKVQQRREGHLRASDKKALHHVLEISNSKSIDVPCMEVFFAQQALKRLRATERDHGSIYLDLRFILATENICEGLLSTTGYRMDDRRQLILPANFECQLYLHMNCHLWDISDVNEMRK